MTRFSATEVQRILSQEGYGVRGDGLPNNTDLSNTETGHVSINTTDTNEMSARFEQMWTLLGGP